MMWAGLTVSWQTLRDMHLKGYVYIWANVAFVCLSLPIFTAPAAFSALMKVGHLSQTNDSEADISSFWSHFRQHIGYALPWGLLNFLFVVIHFRGLPDVLQVSDWWGIPRFSVWFIVTFLWMGMLVYYWPMLYEMARPNRLTAAYNALLMVLLNPLFTLVITLNLMLVVLISMLLPAAWLLLTWGYIAAIGNIAVLNRVKDYLARHPG